MEKVQNNPLYIPLERVESEHCALIVDKGLDRTEGITSHRVELNNRMAVVTPDDTVTLSKSIETIRGLGYGVTTVKKNIPVLKMTCASCAVSVESMIRSIPGVVGASVNFASAMVNVEYLPNMVNEAMMQKAVRSVGYDLLADEMHETQETLEDIRRKQYAALRRKTLGAGLLTLPVVITGMFFMDMHYANEIMWALSTPVVLWFGKDFFINAFKQARHRSANMDTLVAVSTGVAYLFSVFNTLFPAFWHERGLHGHVYFEAAAVVIAFILTGKLLEERAKGSTSSALKKLMGLRPSVVTVKKEDGSLKQIPVEDVLKGDLITVKPGEKIAVDGTVSEGSSYVDESMLSGEPVPVLKKSGEKVFAGTINQKGSFSFLAEKVGSETMLSQIIRMVQDAQGSKAPVQKLVDRIASVFVPVVILIAAISFLCWYLFGGENGFTQGLMAFVTVLVIACPCALGLATPTAIMVGIGKAAEKGILIKDAESLELSRRINAVVLDKTGTITEGKPAVNGMMWLNGDDTSATVLLGMEKLSEHPLAEAVVKYLDQKTASPVTGFQSITGRGAEAMHNGTVYLAGNKKFMEERGVAMDASLLAEAERWNREAVSVIWFAGGGKALAVLAVSDRIKDSSVAAIKALQEAGAEVYMLTGDNEAAAAQVAAKAGIRHYRSEVMPAEKAAFVRQLREKGKLVAMVGDGINDSAALAGADVSIAMGKGSDIAMDVAKMTIISSDLGKIPEAIKISERTVTTLKQNLFWAFIYNIIGIPVAAGALYPLTGYMLDPMIAGAAMAFSSVSVVGNSLRLKWGA